MIKILRKHRNWLMIVIAILTVPFCIYFVKTDTGAIRSDQFARIYDRTVSVTEFGRDARLFELARGLGMIDFLQDVVAPTTKRDASKQEVYAQFTVNLVVLRHEAERLGIKPAQSEIVDLVRSFAPFLGANGFDEKKYDEFAQQVLAPNGFTDAQIEELARDEICVNRIRELVGAAVSVPESESKTSYEEGYSKNFVSIVRLHSADLAKDVKVTDDDMRKYYEMHKTELKTEEKRKIEFVTLALTDEQKKLAGKERIDVLQKLADRANDFTQALLEKDANFQQVAAKFQLPIQATGEFTAATPDPKLKGDAQLAPAAFRLTAQEPNSDPIQVADGFCILHLAGVAEPRPLSIEEAKPRIVDAIKASRASEMLSTAGAKSAHDLRDALKAGKPLPLALEQAGKLKAEKIEPFVLANEPDIRAGAEKPKSESPEMMAIKNTVALIQPGEASEFLPWQDGGMIVVLEKREPPDPAKYQEAKTKFDERLLTNKRTIVFFEWFRERQQEAGVEFAKG